jgi:hypothetical protein
MVVGRLTFHTFPLFTPFAFSLLTQLPALNSSFVRTSVEGLPLHVLGRGPPKADVVILTLSEVKGKNLFFVIPARCWRGPSFIMSLSGTQHFEFCVLVFRFSLYIFRSLFHAIRTPHDAGRLKKPIACFLR